MINLFQNKKRKVTNIMANQTQGEHLGQAHQQWASRPADERFEDIYALIKHLSVLKSSSKEVVKEIKELRALPTKEGDIVIQTPRGVAELSNWSFDQYAIMAGLSGKVFRDACERFVDKQAAAKWVADGLNMGMEGRVKLSETTKMNSEANILVKMMPTDTRPTRSEE